MVEVNNERATPIGKWLKLNWRAFQPYTIIEKYEKTIPQEYLTYIPNNDLKTIKEILNLPIHSTFSLIAVITSSSDIELVLKKNTQEKLRKKTLQLVDDSESFISLTLWEDDAIKFDYAIGTILHGKLIKIKLIEKD